MRRPKNFLCMMAEFDEDSAMRMKRIYQALLEQGLRGRQAKTLPYHITMGLYEEDARERALALMRGAWRQVGPFPLRLGSVGLFGLHVLFLSPDANEQLLALHRLADVDCMTNERGWTPHATILTDQPDAILKAIPIVAREFSPIHATIQSISLYEFPASRLIERIHAGNRIFGEES